MIYTIFSVIIALLTYALRHYYKQNEYHKKEYNKYLRRYYELENKNQSK